MTKNDVEKIGDKFGLCTILDDGTCIWYDADLTELIMYLYNLNSVETQQQIDALKARVNCLRGSLRKLMNAYDCSIDDVYVIADALNTTPEQCLAEVKAKAIEDAVPKMINACIKYIVEKDINTSVEMVSIGQLKHLSEIRHHGEWEQAK